MDELDEVRGGSEPDIRTLHYWSRTAFLFLIIGGVGWAALGVFDLYRGLTWYEFDDITGSTQSIADLSWGAVCLGLAVLSFFVAGRLNRDIVAVFGERRFQVPRDRLMVYSMLGFPLSLGFAGVLLVLVNVKLSHPEFLPSHAEAYPEAMPVRYATVPTPPDAAAAGPEGPPAQVPAASTTFAPGMVELPTTQGPVTAPPQPTAGVTTPPFPAAGTGDQEPPTVMALVEDIPVPAGTPAGEGPVVQAVYEEVPMPTPSLRPDQAPVVAQVEEFEEVLMGTPAPAEVAPPPSRDIKSAHEDLMRKLLKK